MDAMTEAAAMLEPSTMARSRPVRRHMRSLLELRRGVAGDVDVAELIEAVARDFDLADVDGGRTRRALFDVAAELIST